MPEDWYFDDPLPGMIFLKASKGAVNNDWEQNLAAGLNHLDEFKQSSVFS